MDVNWFSVTYSGLCVMSVCSVSVGNVFLYGVVWISDGFNPVVLIFCCNHQECYAEIVHKKGTKLQVHTYGVLFFVIAPPSQCQNLFFLTVAQQTVSF